MNKLEWLALFVLGALSIIILLPLLKLADGAKAVVYSSRPRPAAV